jgi:virulence-associated protein VagC
MVTQTATIKDGKIILPAKLRKPWKKAKVFIFPSDDTLIVKKAQKPLSNLSDLASRVSLPKMSKKEIEKEIQSFRKNK